MRSNGRVEKWAGKALKVGERKLVLLVCASLTGIVLVGTAWEKLQPFIQLLTKASADATEIAKIRSAVEGQRDTIALIARDANQARADMQKAAQLSAEAKKTSEEATKKGSEVAELASKARKEVNQIHTTAEFSLLLASAAADDRKAFDKLITMAGSDRNEFQGLARAAIVRIAGDLGSSLSFGVDWKKVNFDPKTATLAEFEALFSERPAFDKPGIISGLWDQDRFTKYERLSFSYDIIRSTQSILVLNAACIAMNREAKIDKNIIGHHDYLDWWQGHGAAYTGLPIDDADTMPSP